MIKKLPNWARWAMVTAILAITAGAVGYALFTATRTVDHSVSVQGAHNLGLFDVTSFTFADMGPGDVVRGTIGVVNADGAPVSVSTAVSATNADGLGLRSQLVMTIRDLGETSGIPATACTPGDPLYVAAPIVYVGPLGAEPALSIPGMDVVLAVSGDPGDDNGWCVEIELPAATDASFAGALTDGQFILTGVD